MKHFLKIVINCISGFLIKKGYQNSQNRHEKYLKEKINEKFIECNWKLFNINIYKCELNEYKGNTKGVILPDCKIFINIEKY